MVPVKVVSETGAAAIFIPSASVVRCEDQGLIPAFRPGDAIESLGTALPAGLYKMIKTRLRQLVLLLGIVFIFLLILKSWDELGFRLSTINLPVFILSIVIATLGNIFTCLFFKSSLDKYGAHIDYQINFKLFFFGQIAKYIPGKVWSIVYQSMMVNRPGMTPAIVFANFDLAAVQILNCGFIAATILLVNKHVWISLLVMSVGLAACVGAAKTCHLFNFITHFKRYAKGLSKHLCNCSHEFPTEFAVIYYVVFWIAYLGGHLFLLLSAFDMSVDEAVIYVAFLALSWIAGVVAVISPAGLGVREIVFIFLAQSSAQSVSVEVLGAIAVIARFWLVLQELAGVAIVYLYNVYAEGRKQRQA